MNDPDDLKGSFTLDKNHPEGTLISQGSRLVLTCKNCEETQNSVANSSKDKMNLTQICVHLVHLLEEIPGMEKPEARATLLAFGFSSTERSRFRSSDDMHIDLVNIVNYVAELGGLDDLIVNARGHPQGKSNKAELEQVRKYLERFKPISPRRLPTRYEP